MSDKRLEKLVLDSLERFYERRLAKLKKLDLRHILRRKNPFLFRALGFTKASELVERLLESYIWSSDEGIFGDAFFEPIAKEVSGGVISPSEGVDIAIETETRYKAISVKSGPNIFNASQKKKQNQQFMELRSRLLKSGKQFDALLAACYGRVSKEPSDRYIYRIRSGQVFWEEITGDPDFYLKLHHLMGEHPLVHRPNHQKIWAAAVNRFTVQLVQDFGFETGEIDWDKIVQFNSAKEPPVLPRRRRRKGENQN
jgi:hypothetical protein